MLIYNYYHIVHWVMLYVILQNFSQHNYYVCACTDDIYECEITTINKFRALMEKEQYSRKIGDTSKEMEILRIRNQKHYNKGRMPLMDSSVDWTLPRKESVSLKTCQ